MKSVMLPAHAETSSACDPLTCPDLVVGCSTTPDPGDQDFRVVEESQDGCPVLAVAPDTGSQPTATLLIFGRRRFYSGASTGTTDAAIEHIAPGGGGGGLVIRASIDNCDATSGPLNCGGFDQTAFEVIGTLGGSFTLRADSDCDPDTGTVSITNIRIS